MVDYIASINRAGAAANRAQEPEHCFPALNCLTLTLTDGSWDPDHIRTVQQTHLNELEIFDRTRFKFTPLSKLQIIFTVPPSKTSRT